MRSSYGATVTIPETADARLGSSVTKASACSWETAMYSAS
jgi:hypothetical protein